MKLIKSFFLSALTLLTSCVQLTRISEDLAEITRKSPVQNFSAKNIIVENLNVSGAITSSPAISDNEVYFSSLEQNLYAFDLSNGKEIWKFSPGHTIFFTPIVTKNTVYIAADNLLYALDRKRGTINWVFKEAKGLIRSKPIISEGAIFFSNSVGEVYSVSLFSGQKIWKFQTKSKQKLSGMAEKDGFIYFSSDDQHLYAFDTITGQEKWKIKIKGKLNAPSVFGDTIFFAADNGFFYAVDISSGKEKWKYLANDSVVGAPAVSKNRVFFSSWNGNLYSLDQESGELVWKFSFKEPITGAPCIYGENIYFGSWDKNLYNLDLETGEIKGVFFAGELVAPPVVASGNLIFGTWNGDLYRIIQKK